MAVIGTIDLSEGQVEISTKGSEFELKYLFDTKPVEKMVCPDANDALHALTLHCIMNKRLWHIV